MVFSGARRRSVGLPGFRIHVSSTLLTSGSWLWPYANASQPGNQVSKTVLAARSGASVVDEPHADPFRLDLETLRQRAAKPRLVHVAPDGGHGRELLELVEELSRGQVSGVQDERRLPQRRRHPSGSPRVSRGMCVSPSSAISG